jgi:hypothetical protein
MVKLNRARTLATIIAALFLAIPTSVPAADAPASQPAMKIVSWNAYSKQFIDPPTFTLLPIHGATVYRAVVTQGDRNWRIESPRPDVSLVKVWAEMATKKFTVAFEWADAAGKLIDTQSASVHVKAPDWSGFHEPPADWKAAADRGTGYLIDVAEHGKAPYREPGVPIWIWSAATPYKDAPDGLDVSYPCIMVPNIIWGMTAHVRANGPQRDAALHLARTTADWSLQHRLPDSGALPLFPYSTVAHGQFGGGADGENVNLLRASWYALGLMDLYEATGRSEQKYLEYARHIATVTTKFQALDGSFPYRVNMKTAAVAEAYTPGAAEFALLVDALKPYGVSSELLIAQQRAVRWVIAYVAATNHWQAVYEDVSMPKPYANLSQMQAQAFIRYLCLHKDEDPTYLPLAERVNRWVEDQFVLFGPSDSFDRQVKGPLVFEQFVCWYPMEGHTAFWMASLLDLHRVTGKPDYLEKAKAAGNAIVAQQFEDGSFSTWAVRSFVDGKVTGENPGGNWYNANVMAVEALYRLDGYLRSAN